MTTTQETPLQPDFRERAKSNDVAVARLIGFEAKEIAEGRATVTFSAEPRHANPMGRLHGILCDIADVAMGIAFASTLAPEESFTTVKLKIKFLSTGMGGSTHSGGKGRAARPHDGLCGGRNNRRGEPTGR